jgi:hypothetical protein
MTLCNIANKSYTCSHVENFEQASRVETCFNHSLIKLERPQFLKNPILPVGKPSQKNHKTIFQRCFFVRCHCKTPYTV